MAAAPFLLLVSGDSKVAGGSGLSICVRNGPRPAKRAIAEAILRALDWLPVVTTVAQPVPEVSLHHPHWRTLVAARSSLAAQRDAFGPSSWPLQRSHRRASALAPALLTPVSSAHFVA